jgi:hypothetical protein
MLAVLAYVRVYGKNQYPGFSNDPLHAFKDLLYDLKTFAKDFISGSGNEFEAHISHPQKHEVTIFGTIQIYF